MGRKPKPTKLQMAEGDPRKHGTGKLQEKLAAQPIAAKGLLDGPAHLEGLALETFNFWRQELQAMNLDAKPDAQMLEGAAVAYARAVEADKRVTLDGIVIDVPIFDKEGIEIGSRQKAHPAIAISNQAWKNVKGFCSEFGLSPVSRTRLTIEKQDDGAKEMRELLTKPRKKEAVQ